ncbi:MAG: hypothetical protein KC478_09645 [Bacteriovoracaceae bacterium]|nr:hypothetical protein [Bacteriovoracaceae bacterium]
MDGGIVMKGVRYDENGEVLETITVDLPESHLITIPSGDWDLFFVGYTGPSEWTGTNYCGVVEANLTTPDATLDITIDTTTCATEPYLTIISEKAAASTSVWDTAVWDSATWGP